MKRKRAYKRLTEDEREEISRYLAIGDSFQEIGVILGRSVSTISREVGKAGCNRWTYRAGRAQRRAIRNARKRRLGKRKIIQLPKLRIYVEEQLRLRWSPEQIAKRIKKAYPEDMTMRISHEAIYAHVYVLPKGTLKKELLKCLRRMHKRRYRKRGKSTESRPLKDMVSIEERPAEVEDRIVPGHWEGDLMIGVLFRFLIIKIFGSNRIIEGDGSCLCSLNSGGGFRTGIGFGVFSPTQVQKTNLFAPRSNTDTIPALFFRKGLFPIKAYYENESDFTDFHNRLKGLPCPHCRLPGFLILHGFLYGYAEDQHTTKSKRGRRFFCSNRKNRNGCGRTFSLLLSSFIKHFTISAKTLWHFFLNFASNLNRLQAFKQARGPLTVSSIYRLFKRFQQVQARIRTLLLSVKDPPLGHGITDPAVQTIRHLHSLVHDDSCPIAAFQLRFQVSFF